MKEILKYQQYEKHYSDEALLYKISKFFGKLSYKLLNKVVTLWFTLNDRDTPTWAKTIIIGALGYFILPVDAIPDLVPIFGFSDDMTALISATTIIWAHIKPEHQKKASEKVKKLFSKE